MLTIKFLTVQHNSALYKQTVRLRYEILRRPLGLTFTDAQLSAEDKDIHLAGIDQNRAICCCLILTPLDGKTVQMRQVAVAKQEQGKGTGRQLVEYSEKITLQNGYDKIMLHARDTAVEFYLKLGYEPEGEQFFEVGIPHLQMRKNLLINESK